MKYKKYSPEQIVKILREAERADSAREVIRRHGITEQTFYRWKKVYAHQEAEGGAGGESAFEAARFQSGYHWRRAADPEYR